jgi:alpha-1,6-mannosyltransferase
MSTGRSPATVWRLVSQALPATAGRAGARVLIAADARRIAGSLMLAGVVSSGFLIAAGAAGERSSFVPGRKGGYPGWLHEPLSSLHLGLDPNGIVVVLAAMWAFYAGALLLARAIPPRWALAAILSLHAVFLLGPPLISTDVFNYIEYGRLGVLHGLNPYAHGPSAAPGDAAFPFIGWQTATSVYGPTFTLGTYATAPLGVGGALWAMKALAAASSLACVWLVWRCAELLGRPPLRAAMLFGLNPLLLVFAVGGAHNDLLMLALALAGVMLVLEGRERRGGLAAVGAVTVKASSALLLPYLLIGAHKRGRLLAGALAGAVVGAAIWIVAFHGAVGPFFDTLRWQQHHGSLHSVPKALGSVVGISATEGWLRSTCSALLVLALGLTLWRAYRTREWLVPAGWGTFALLVTTVWLLPWYVVWLLPIAAISGDRKLTVAMFALCAFVIGMRVPIWLTY